MSTPDYYTDAPPMMDDPSGFVAPVTAPPVRPAAGAGELLPLLHVSQMEERMVAELRLRREFGADAMPGEPVGLAEVDREVIIDGGQLIVLGARPGVGKTALALYVARHIATRKAHDTGKGGKVLYIITEMDVQAAVERVVIALAQVTRHDLYRDVREDVITAVQAAFNVLRDSGLVFANATGRPVDDIVATIAHAKQAQPDLRTVFVDNLTGVGKPRGSRSTREDQWLGDITQALTEVAVAHRLPVWLLVHLKRSDVKVPGEQDIAGSDRVSRWADTILLMHEKDGPEGAGEWDPDSLRHFGGDQYSSEAYIRGNGTHELKAAKNRGGRKFEVDLRFIGEHMRFEDPNGPSVRPLTVPAPERARVAEFRRRRAELPEF